MYNTNVSIVDYNMNNIKPVYEFLLWDNCHNNCDFCFQKASNNLSTLTDKQRAIQLTIDFIKSDQYEPQSHVLLMGGELFDDRHVFNDLCRLFDYIVDQMSTGHIDLLYLNTNLLYKDKTCLYYLLDKATNIGLGSRLRFTTSYDKQGRFKTLKAEQLMLSNLADIRQRYDGMSIVVNMMLSKQLCTEILHDQFNVKQFGECHGAYVNLIPYIVLDERISAKKSAIFATLKKVNDSDGDYLSKYTNNLSLRQEKRLYRYNVNTKTIDFCTCDTLPCGHAENFKRYSFTGTCFLCDLIEFVQGFE